MSERPGQTENILCQLAPLFPTIRLPFIAKAHYTKATVLLGPS